MATKHDKSNELQEKLKALAIPVQTALGADLVIYGGSMDYKGCWRLSSDIRANHSAKNCLVMLTTFGGFADPAYRLARCLQQVYKDGCITLFIDTFCKSAGTILAIAADAIIMADAAEIGPLDVQIKKADELDERTSGLTAMQALSTLRTEAYVTFEQFLKELRKNTRISTRLASELAEKLTVGLLTPIYAQMEPMKLGENNRSMSVATEYGERLAKHTENLRDKTLEKLTSGYPSHEFVIDRTEAAELFKTVRPPSEDEVKLSELTYQLVCESVFTDDPEKSAYSQLILFKPQSADKTPVEPGDTKNDNIPEGANQGHGSPAEAPETATGPAQSDGANDPDAGDDSTINETTQS